MDQKSKDSLLIAERLQREKDFHDDRFADDSDREATGKFYRAVPGATRDYVTTAHRLAGGRVLEYGCGVGSLGFDLSSDAEVVGIDISSVAIDVARRTAAERSVTATFLEMNAEDLTFDEDSFDMVCGSGILHHLDIAKAMDGLARVVRPGGRAVFLEPMGYNPLINLYRSRTPGMRTDDEHPLLTADFGLIRERVRHLDLRFHGLAALGAAPLLDRPGGPVLHKGLMAIDQVLTRVPKVQLLSWIVVLELSF